MRRNSSRTLIGAASAALAAVLLIAGGLLLWGSAYVHNTVQGQLSAQQITFPPAAAFAHPKAGSEITPNMIPSVSQYAGQQLLTGQQAEAYADHFIAQHITDMSGGKTYSQLSTESLAQPNNTQLAGCHATQERVTGKRRRGDLDHATSPLRGKRYPQVQCAPAAPAVERAERPRRSGHQAVTQARGAAED